MIKNEKSSLVNFIVFLADTSVTPRPCEPSPCGANAICREQNGLSSCTCLPEYIGNPYEGCRPECIRSSDCPSHLACIRSKCQNPCPGSCGANTNCQVVNNLPVCTCIPQYTGDPYVNCVYKISSSELNLIS